MPEWLQVVGRFHPVVLHAPIGLLFGLLAVEVIGAAKRDPAWTSVARLLAWLVALSAVTAAVSGFVLGRESSYTGDTVDLHRILGIAIAGLALLTACVYLKSGSPWPRRLFALLLLGALLPAAHLGGTISHGEDFLFAPLREARTGARRQAASGSETSPGTPLADGASSGVLRTEFKTSIAPIRASNCVGCHGPSKRKGGLTLHTPDAITKGGDFGPVVTPGHPEASEIIRRVRLPLGDEDHMPPEGKPQPTEDQIRAIEAWIASGAVMDERSVVTPPETSATIGARTESPSTPERPAAPLIPAPDAAALAALQNALVHAEPVSQGSNLLVVSFASIAPRATDELVAKLLTPLRDQIEDLSLSRAAITDATLDLLASMPRLRRLDLRATKVSPGSLAALKSHPALEELVIAQTGVGDESAEALRSMPALKRVYAWKSALSEPALARLREQRPSLQADAGEKLETTAAATEGDLKFSSDAPVPGAPVVAAVPAADALKPVNAACPVSGQPVNPKYLVVYNGKVIGFCCPNCPKEFWQDPAKFEAALSK